MGIITSIVLAAAAIAGAGASAYSSSAATTSAKKIADNETFTANRLADEARADKLKLESDTKANQDKLKEASGVAATEARREDMIRRSKATKTLLTGSLGVSGQAETEKKTLLGG